MNTFVWALAGFVVLHIGVSATGLRARLVGATGEGVYRGVFSLASLGLLAWMMHGYGTMRADPFDALNGAIWTPPDWLRWPSIILSGLGVTLAFTGLLTPGPTLAGYEKIGLAKDEPAQGVLRITRHPFLWGVALWAAGHLLANGERFAVMLFGALGLMVILGARSIDRKGTARAPVAWARFADVTSNVPFIAITQGRNRLALGEIGWRGLVGLAIAIGIVLAHEWVFGVSAIATSP
jgi:uncharacterized membrane protein